MSIGSEFDAQAVFDFLVVSFVIFIAIRGINKLKKPPAQAPAVDAPPPRQEILLAEIRDALVRR